MISVEDSKRLAVFATVASIGLLFIIFFIPVTLLKALALLGLIPAVWLCIFGGSTAIACALTGELRRRFQVGISILVPAVMSLYFFKDMPVVTYEGVMGHMFNVPSFVMLCITGYVSWSLANLLDRDLPFRGFQIACTVLFVPCFMGHNEIGFMNDYDGSSTIITDKESATYAKETGRYFGQFLGYIAVAYAGMFLKLRKQAKSLARQSRKLS